MDEKIKIGSELRKFREKLGLNQKQIAEYLNVDQSYISKCEKDERQLSVDSLEKLCALFGCSITDLFEEHKEKKPMTFAFRANMIDGKDLHAISEINKIALNINQMRKLLKEN